MTSQSTLAEIAIQNPIFQNAAKKAVFQSIAGEDVEEQDRRNQQGTIADEDVLNITEEELAIIKKWARILRFSMIAIATGLILVAFFNFAGSSISTSMLSLYLFLFSLLLCCFECGIKQVAYVIVQNFGFMYNSVGRVLFLLLVAFISFEVSLLGKVMFGLMLGYGFLSCVIYCKHPMYGKYMRNLHFYNREAKSSHTQDQQHNAVTV